MNATHDRRRCKLISFSGIDGAGKGTQIERLCSQLKAAGLQVLLITFWDDVATLTRMREATGHKLFKGDKGVGSPAAPINRRDKNVRSWPMSAVRLGLYFLDALSLRATVAKALVSGADFVICDRYIYDELANLTLSNPAARVYVRQIMKLVPKPDISYILDADPVQTRKRKPEYPLDFLHINRASYLTLSNLVGATVIPQNSIENVERDILEHAQAELSFAAAGRESEASVAEA